MEAFLLIPAFSIAVSVWSMGTTLEKIEKHLAKIADNEEPSESDS